MVLNTFMNFLESVAITKPIEFYFNGAMLATLELHEHNDRYRAFMSEYGLYSVKNMDFDEYSKSYIVHL